MKQICIVVFALLFLADSPALAGSVNRPEKDVRMALAEDAERQDAARRLRELEGTWLFDAVKTSRQLISSSDNELSQRKFKNKLELQYGNQCLDIRVTDAGALRLNMYNRYDEPEESTTFEMHAKYNSYRDYFGDDKVGLIAIRDGTLAFQSHHSELSLLFTKIK